MSGAAASVLAKIMLDTNAPASTRVRAADSVLDRAKKAIEIEDIEARVSELERPRKRPRTAGASSNRTNAMNNISRRIRRLEEERFGTAADSEFSRRLRQRIEAGQRHAAEFYAELGARHCCRDQRIVGSRALAQSGPHQSSDRVRQYRRQLEAAYNRWHCRRCASEGLDFPRFPSQGANGPASFAIRTVGGAGVRTFARLRRRVSGAGPSASRGKGLQTLQKRRTIGATCHRDRGMSRCNAICFGICQFGDYGENNDLDDERRGSFRFRVHMRVAEPAANSVMTVLVLARPGAWEWLRVKLFIV